MRVEYLYNDRWNTSTFYVWKGMELVDKFIYEGKMDTEEVKKTKERIEKENSTNSRKSK
jgi:hypothetical protein